MREGPRNPFGGDPPYPVTAPPTPTPQSPQTPGPLPPPNSLYPGRSSAEAESPAPSLHPLSITTPDSNRQPHAPPLFQIETSRGRGRGGPLRPGASHSVRKETRTKTERKFRAQPCCTAGPESELKTNYLVNLK